MLQAILWFCTKSVSKRRPCKKERKINIQVKKGKKKSLLSLVLVVSTYKHFIVKECSVLIF